MFDKRMLKNNDIFCIEAILPFYHCFSQYKFGIDLGTVVLAIALIKLLLEYGLKISIGEHVKPFLLLFVYVLFRDFLKLPFHTCSDQILIHNIIAYSILFFITFFLSSQLFDENKLYRYWKIAGLIFGLGLFYHVIQIFLFNVSIKPISIIPGYVIREEAAVAGFRPCSFFSEPAAFISSMFPLLFLSLKRNDFKIAMLTTLCIFLSTSSAGIIISFVLWATNVIKIEKFSKKLIFLAGLVLMIIIFINLPIFQNSYEKMEKISNGGSTFSTRILDGLEVNSSQSFSSLLFGENYNIVDDYIRDNHIMFNLSHSLHFHSHVYLNTFAEIIFKYGFLGVLLYIYSFLQSVRRDSLYMLPFFVAIMISSLGQSRFLNSTFFTSVLLILLLSQKQPAIEKENNCGKYMVYC